ncbi:MAG: hypothetical protein K0R66_352 [Gammaproteobacteria bacterium]|nr:hypothetical protein [Gammaproteobacteria bacterium]
MSRYSCNLFSDGKLVDGNCIFGFDEPMETFFFQSGVEDEDGAPVIWLGYTYQQFPNFTSLLLKLQKHEFALQVDEDTLSLAKGEITQFDYSIAKDLLVH